MNCHTKLGTGIATLITGSLLILTPLDSVAANQLAPDGNKKPKPAIVVELPCPAADTTPACEIVRRPHNPRSDGSQDERRPIPADSTDVRTGNTKDHPGYGPSTRQTTPTDWVDNIGIGCRRVPWPQIVACPD
jgi:hypothetical protein